ncbi:unnamed protein product [Moneuplotes crassus]|uniref:Uncharacterized protein n=1 Tax=Euplotes crassus TaxID=5936 RepID=A0AAD1UNF9_EUPCR|nr:unnamed protein product [Moneuplotes crassus]
MDEVIELDSEEVIDLGSEEEIISIPMDQQIPKLTTPCQVLQTSPNLLFKKSAISTYLLERLEKEFYDEVPDNQSELNLTQLPSLTYITPDGCHEFWNSFLFELGKKINEIVINNCNPCIKSSDKKAAKKIRYCIMTQTLRKLKERCKLKLNSKIGFTDFATKSFALTFFPDLFQGEVVEDKLKLFFDYIILCFPEVDVKNLLNRLLSTGYFTKSEYNFYIYQFKGKRACSLLHAKMMVKNNRCFRKIFERVLWNVQVMGLDEEERVREVIENVLGLHEEVRLSVKPIHSPLFKGIEESSTQDFSVSFVDSSETVLRISPEKR